MAPLTVLDASALIGALVGEPAGPEVEKLLRGSPSPSISAVNLAEVIEGRGTATVVQNGSDA